MGPTLNDVARALSRAMPSGGVCVTAERGRRLLLEREARRRDCKLLGVDPDDVSDEEMRRFGYITFKENVAIARGGRRRARRQPVGCAARDVRRPTGSGCAHGQGV
jgi:hypothetical protein